jgi:glycosyltransferase involved in cell wall biosynthesis
MQSGAMGLPSIVTDINGCNEIIQTDNNGIFVPTKDMKSLKRAMLRIFQDKELFLKCSANSRLAIVNNYEQKKYWNALLKEYRSY